MSSAAPAGGPPGHPALSQYEMERLENMRRNGEVLASLGLAPLVPSAPPSGARLKLCAKRERAPMAPSRTSERLQELPRARYDDDSAYRRMMVEHVQELRARRKQRRRERATASERGASEEGEASDDSEASGGDAGGAIVAHEPAADDAWDNGLPDGHAVVVEEAEGVELHLSRRSATGYRNVTFMRNSARRPYTVWAPRCINTMQGRKGETKICLGHYSTATAAALRYARYVGDPRTGIDFAAKQVSPRESSTWGRVRACVMPEVSLRLTPSPPQPCRRASLRCRRAASNSTSRPTRRPATRACAATCTGQSRASSACVTERSRPCGMGLGSGRRSDTSIPPSRSSSSLSLLLVLLLPRRRLRRRRRDCCCCDARTPS